MKQVSYKKSTMSCLRILYKINNDEMIHYDCFLLTPAPSVTPVVKPSLQQLMNEVIPEITTKWYTLGIQLSLSDKQLDEMEHNHPRDCSRCCIEMFKRWLSQEAGTVSWSTLVAALRSKAVNEKKLAVKVEENHVSYNL